MVQGQGRENLGIEEMVPDKFFEFAALEQYRKCTPQFPQSPNPCTSHPIRQALLPMVGRTNLITIRREDLENSSVINQIYNSSMLFFMSLTELLQEQY